MSETKGGDGMEWRTMTAKQLAEKLDGREYLNEITPEEEKEAEANGLVAVYGYSDDNVELAGAISDEIGAWEGVVFHVDKDGGYHIEDSDAPNRIRAVWCAPGSDAAWTFETEIPHETFSIYEDGELFCVGIVFRMEDLK